MLSLLRQRNFALLWFGGLISIMGDRVLLTALPFYVYQRTGSTLISAILVASRIIPSFVFGSLAGVFVDRMDRKKMMVITCLGQGAALLPILLITRGAPLWIVYLVSFSQTTLAIFFSPAENALLPQLVSEDKLMPANALNAMNNNVARLIGPPVGGVILAWWGLTGVVLFDSLTFVIAALMIALIRVPRQGAVPAKSEPEPGLLPKPARSAWSQFWHEWREGVQIIGADSVVFWLFITIILLNMGGTMIDPLWAPYVIDVVKMDSQTFGLVLTLQAVGGILGGLAAGKVGQRMAPALIYGLGEVILGLVLFVRYNVPVLPVLFATAFLTGLPAAIGAAAMQTIFQQKVPNSHLGRVDGVMNTVIAVVSLFGVLGIAGTLGEVLGIVPVLNIAAAITLLAGLIILRFLAFEKPAGQPVWLDPQDETGSTGSQ